jgi:hypothetical protein
LIKILKIYKNRIEAIEKFFWSTEHGCSKPIN